MPATVRSSALVDLSFRAGARRRAQSTRRCFLEVHGQGDAFVGLLPHTLQALPYFTHEHVERCTNRWRDPTGHRSTTRLVQHVERHGPVARSQPPRGSRSRHPGVLEVRQQEDRRMVAWHNDRVVQGAPAMLSQGVCRGRHRAAVRRAVWYVSRGATCPQHAGHRCKGCDDLFCSAWCEDGVECECYGARPYCFDPKTQAVRERAKLALQHISTK